jgi:hypothetical protein
MLRCGTTPLFMIILSIRLRCIMTLSIMELWLMTHSTTTLFMMILSIMPRCIMTLSIHTLSNIYRVLMFSVIQTIVLLSVISLNVIMVSTVMQGVIILFCVMLSIVVLKVIMLSASLANVILLNVLAPFWGGKKREWKIGESIPLDSQHDQKLMVDTEMSHGHKKKNPF